MKDSQDRVEANVNRLLTGQEVQREILRNQDIKIEDISIIQQKNVDGLSDLKIAMASHIGAHVGLPEKGDRGDAGKRGDRGERGQTGDHGHKGDTGETGPRGDTA